MENVVSPSGSVKVIAGHEPIYLSEQFRALRWWWCPAPDGALGRFSLRGAQYEQR